MDVRMPNMGGYETTERIRSMRQYQDIPIIAMTAHALKGDREKCLEAGMNDYIAKPINVKELFSTLSSWIQINSPSVLSPKEVSPKEDIGIPSRELLEGFDIEASMRTKGFEEDHGNVDKEIEEAIHAGNVKEVSVQPLPYRKKRKRKKCFLTRLMRCYTRRNKKGEIVVVLREDTDNR